MKHLHIVPLVATGSHLKQGLPMRKILSLCLAVILMTGCESDFDKCMRTELPRSSSDLKLEDARQTLAKLSTALKKSQIMKSLREDALAWVEANPEPSGSPEYPDYEPPSYEEDYDNWKAYNAEHNRRKEEYKAAKKTWEASPEFISYKERGEAEVLKLMKNAAISAGITIATTDEFLAWVDFNAMQKLITPRAERKGCWGNDKCENPLFLEREHRLAQDEDTREINEWVLFLTAVKESIEWQTEELARLEKLAPETAIRACNANGFYE